MYPSRPCPRAMQTPLSPPNGPPTPLAFGNQRVCYYVTRQRRVRQNLRSPPMQIYCSSADQRPYMRACAAIQPWLQQDEADASFAYDQFEALGGGALHRPPRLDHDRAKFTSTRSQLAERQLRPLRQRLRRAGPRPRSEQSSWVSGARSPPLLRRACEQSAPGFKRSRAFADHVTKCAKAR